MSKEEEKKYNFELTEMEASTVLVGLTKLPYERSADIIEQMKEQFAGQYEQTEALPKE